MMMSFASRDITEIVVKCKVTNNWPGYLATAFSTGRHGVGSVVRDMYYSATVSYPQNTFVWQGWPYSQHVRMLSLP